MSEPTPAQQIPAQTEAAATDENALPLDKLALIGTLNGPSGPAALLRLRRGTIRRVTPGDRIDGAHVRAIGEGEIVLERRTGSQRLSMPRG